MLSFDDLKPGVRVRGILTNSDVLLEAVKITDDLAEITFRDGEGRLQQELVYSAQLADLELVEGGVRWPLDADPGVFKLASEARRIQLAYLFDPMMAVYTSLVEPLPHQIEAVYHHMLPRRPLRFLLADDPGAGKTIMSGLYMRELMLRGDLERCLVVAPGSLVEQWQDELSNKFHLPFDILSRDRIEASRTSNPFADQPLWVVRLDQLSRNDELQDKLKAVEWDLIVIDEAHKMSASYFAGEISPTKRYRLGQALQDVTRHFLLLTATPHSGKEEDFQLFLKLIDAERFEGRFRHGTPKIDPSDLMRRLVKEDLLRFDGTPLFPERKAYTVNYELSPLELELYEAVTAYVQQEMNRADALESDRRGTVGFALTMLQRRLASSPRAIYRSLERRRERLEARLEEAKQTKERIQFGPVYSLEDIDEYEEFAGEEFEGDPEVLDLATAALTVQELGAEIASLRRLEALARHVLQSRQDRKWEELSRLLQDTPEMTGEEGRRKLVIFTEHRDTLDYLAEHIRTLLGKDEAVVTIHGGLRREERKEAQTLFTQDKDTTVLVATDAAGEGINLQVAHLMVNYDLPWNPNRLEQRFGRIHRIGQTEVCHMWNLVAEQTREGDVYSRLLKKLEVESEALGGKVFDVLGRGNLFQNIPLRSLLIDAVRYGERADVRERLYQAIDGAVDHERLSALLEREALASEMLEPSRLQALREQMEQAEARRLQPHFIASFLVTAFEGLGGTIHPREGGRYEISHVSSTLREAAKARGRNLPRRYQRITLEKDRVSVPGKPPAEFVVPGHPLLDTVIETTLERHGDLLSRGTVLIDPEDLSGEPRVLFALQHDVEDSRATTDGRPSIASRRMVFVEVTERGEVLDAGYAPYLDYRPPAASERGRLEPLLESFDVEPWQDAAETFAKQKLARDHFTEVKNLRETYVNRTLEAVRERLYSEITYWDMEAYTLAQAAKEGKANAAVNAQKARNRADDLRSRLERRERQLEGELRLRPKRPLLTGAALVVPKGYFADAAVRAPDRETRERIERIAVEAVLAAERRRGFEPKEMPPRNPGYDILSKDPSSQGLRFIEVKGKGPDATVATISRTQIMTALNKRDGFILALVETDGERATGVHYLKRPFGREPDFGVTSVNYDLAELLARAERVA